ncbi:MAG: hypothetical protein JSS02_16425 [Planctomycetes bacterium]|nr:hypothetical protein [Planctomycetota bacterium]
MSLKLEPVSVPAEVLALHEQAGGAELEMFAVARRDGFLRLTVGTEMSDTHEGRVTHISVSFAASSDPHEAPTRRPNDKELREVRAHFADLGTFEEDNSRSDARGLVRHLWSEQD